MWRDIAPCGVGAGHAVLGCLTSSPRMLLTGIMRSAKWKYKSSPPPPPPSPLILRKQLVADGLMTLNEYKRVAPSPPKPSPPPQFADRRPTNIGNCDCETSYSCGNKLTTGAACYMRFAPSEISLESCNHACDSDNGCQCCKDSLSGGNKFDRATAVRCPPLPVLPHCMCSLHTHGEPVACDLQLYTQPSLRCCVRPHLQTYVCFSCAIVVPSAI